MVASCVNGSDTVINLAALADAITEQTAPLTATELDVLIAQARGIAQQDGFWAQVQVKNRRWRACPADMLGGTTKLVVYANGQAEIYEDGNTDIYRRRAFMALATGQLGEELTCP